MSHRRVDGVQQSSRNWPPSEPRLSPAELRPLPDATEDSGDARLIASVLMDAALCVDCIVQKTSLPALRVYVALVAIAQALDLLSGRSLCSDCMIIKHVYKLR